MKDKKDTIAEVILKSNLKCIWTYAALYFLINNIFSIFVKGNKDFYLVMKDKKDTIAEVILKSNLKCIWTYAALYFLINNIFSIFVKGNKDFYGMVISILLLLIIGCYIYIYRYHLFRNEGRWFLHKAGDSRGNRNHRQSDSALLAVAPNVSNRYHRKLHSHLRIAFHE